MRSERLRETSVGGCKSKEHTCSSLPWWSLPCSISAPFIVQGVLDLRFPCCVLAVVIHAEDAWKSASMYAKEFPPLYAKEFSSISWTSKSIFFSCSVWINLGSGLLCPFQVSQFSAEEKFSWLSNFSGWLKNAVRIHKTLMCSFSFPILNHLFACSLL